MEVCLLYNPTTLQLLTFHRLLPLTRDSDDCLAIFEKIFTFSLTTGMLGGILLAYESRDWSTRLYLFRKEAIPWGWRLVF
jgi:hypothetical protein